MEDTRCAPYPHRSALEAKDRREGSDARRYPLSSARTLRLGRAHAASGRTHDVAWSIAGWRARRDRLEGTWSRASTRPTILGARLCAGLRAARWVGPRGASRPSRSVEVPVGEPRAVRLTTRTGDNVLHSRASHARGRCRFLSIHKRFLGVGIAVDGFVNRRERA